MVEVTSLVKNIESRLTSNIAKVSGEVEAEKALQDRVNERTSAELERIEALANKRNSDDIRARGALRAVMDENKAAAKEEVAELRKQLTAGIEELRSKNAAHKKAQDEAHATLTSNIGAATAKSAAELKTAQAMFDSKIVMLTNTVVANHKAAE